MSNLVINEVRHGFYLDSVALMRFSRAISEMDGIEEAALMMGTPANRRLMAVAGLLGPDGENAAGGDLIIGIRAANAEAGEAARVASARLIDRPAAAGKGLAAWRPRSMGTAIRALPEANLALISVSGAFAVAEARKAIRRGLHAMIFSNNVAVADEAALKREANELGRLVMGPDCGTAIINGVPLAFANQVPRGNIGVVGASGTGMQEVCCLIARGGRGISQAIGVGGRDLSDEVGGISTLMALEALDGDPDTAHVILISKPPSMPVASRVLERIEASGKRFTVCFVGAERVSVPDNAVVSATLKQAANSALGEAAVATDFDPIVEAVPVAAGRARIIGLFSGGTLCAEAQVILRSAGEAVASNAPIPGIAELTGDEEGHAMLDLGDDAYTRGRPHPMIDPIVRDDAIIQALNGADVGVVLVDLVIGYGAHDDPAGHLASLLSGFGRDDGLVVIASVTGTEEDPQRRSTQIEKLEAVGVRVAPSNADAAALALSCIRYDH